MATIPDSEPLPLSGLNDLAAHDGRKAPPQPWGKALRPLVESLLLLALFAVWAAFWIGFILWLTA